MGDYMSLNYDLDVHNMTVEEAKRTIQKTIMSLPCTYSQVTVIHGYSNGNKLLNMVRGKSLKCKRIKQKVLTLNQGQTILILNNKS